MPKAIEFSRESLQKFAIEHINELGDFMPKITKNHTKLLTNIGKYIKTNKTFLINYICAKNKKLFNKWFMIQSENYKKRKHISDNQFKRIIENNKKLCNNNHAKLKLLTKIRKLNILTPDNHKTFYMKKQINGEIPIA